MTTEQPTPDDANRPLGLTGDSVVSLARAVARAMRRMEHVDARVDELAQVILELAAKLTGGKAKRAGDAEDTGVRSWLLADDAAQAAADLDELTVWLWRVYLWWPDAWLSSCWLWHPEVIEELWWLRVAHADAYAPDTGSSLRVADWHERHRPGVARRVRGVLGKCELSRHAAVNGRPVEVVPPGPSAMARHTGAIAAIWCAGAGLDVIRAAGPDPTPDQLAEAHAYQQALYRSRR